MPIILEAVPRTSVGAGDCAAQNTVTAPEPQDHFGPAQVVIAKPRAIRVAQGQRATIQWTLTGPDGRPVDLTTCLTDDSSSMSSEAVAASVQIRLAEVIGGGCVAVIDADVIDSVSGLIAGELPAEVFNTPAIYIAEAALINDDEDDSIAFSNQFYVLVESGLFGSGSYRGPPTVSEIRLRLRDFREENYLLDVVDFDAAETAAALSRPVQYWNEIPPPIRRYTTANFPHRHIWIEGCIAELCFIAAEHYRRNDLRHSAAGVDVADKAKEASYLQEGVRRQAEFKELVQSRKVADNAKLGYGSTGSPYRYGSGGW